ncbi:MAG TPA: biotin--[acetyl-CoA-carboxylase] ligase [Xanthobacteraceae bacterium]|jgi:BirA family biotin operon repressor/biotin-[acetyl-CoA-carboxylase] ligase|nr:biotin--[acetyl-CoA-carboxylase] ligase [Xanthobacteraceae bacterium]
MMDLDPRAVAAGVRLAAFDEIDSTNAEALRRMRQGERGPLWITADRQTAGRGRRGRSWVSVSGNLHASLLLTDPGPAERWPQLSFVAALAVHDAVVEVAAEVRPLLELKWPNDLLLSGAKFAGILTEGEGRDEEGAVAIGIGVNCMAHPAGTAYPATDLQAAGAAVAPAALFAALSLKMLGRLAQWNRGEGFATVRTDWLARAAGVGGQIKVAVADGELVGRFAGLDDAGCLILIAPSGDSRVVAAGDVIAFAGPQ